MKAVAAPEARSEPGLAVKILFTAHFAEAGVAVAVGQISKVIVPDPPDLTVDIRRIHDDPRLIQRNHGKVRGERVFHHGVLLADAGGRIFRLVTVPVIIPVRGLEKDAPICNVQHKDSPAHVIHGGIPLVIPFGPANGDAMEFSVIPPAVFVLVVETFRKTVFDRVIATSEDDNFFGGGGVYPQFGEERLAPGVTQFLEPSGSTCATLDLPLHRPGGRIRRRDIQGPVASAAGSLTEDQSLHDSGLCLRRSWWCSSGRERGSHPPCRSGYPLC